MGMVLGTRIRCLTAALLIGGCTPSTGDDAGAADAGDAGGAGVVTDGGEDSEGDVEVPLEIPADLAGGFVDLTEGLDIWPPFAIHPGDVVFQREPDVT